MNEELDKSLNRKAGFKHVAINAQRQCRLLRISYDGIPQTSIYSLKVVPLEDLPSIQYKALSYTWGHVHTLDDIQEIQLDNQIFFIRRNLSDFLAAAAASKNENGHFFIDAICINQLDYSEREAQVQEMTRIYRNANEVIAWLGLPAPEQVDNVQTLSQTSRADCGFWTAAQWAGFKYLSYQNFWSRIWIIQEVLLAPSMTVWCGTFTFPLSLFGGTSSNQSSHELGLLANGRPSTVLDYTSRLSSPAEIITTHRLCYVPRPLLDPLAQGTKVGTIQEITTDLRKATEIIVTYQSLVSDPLCRLIRKFRALQCSDPRDKLYGFLGILNPSSRAKVIVDYSKDVSYVYYQALKIGLEELYGERNDVVIPKRGDTTYLAYYCDVRDMFGIEDRESLGILRRVLDELNFETEVQEARFEAQWERQFGFRDDAEVEGLVGFKELIVRARLTSKEVVMDVDDGVHVLSNFHMKQQKVVENL
ncbi:hypothetical protein DL98DRAFT_593983 [Cadophora sp. DSE1049]|nr:hypothetical protein DL98DRAFT_593983 [Cadophora sp. DSE1049]